MQTHTQASPTQVSMCCQLLPINSEMNVRNVTQLLKAVYHGLKMLIYFQIPHNDFKIYPNNKNNYFTLYFTFCSNKPSSITK